MINTEIRRFAETPDDGYREHSDRPSLRPQKNIL